MDYYKYSDIVNSNCDNDDNDDDDDDDDDDTCANGLVLIVFKIIITKSKLMIAMVVAALVRMIGCRRTVHNRDEVQDSRKNLMAYIFHEDLGAQNVKMAIFVITFVKKSRAHDGYQQHNPF